MSAITHLNSAPIMSTIWRLSIPNMFAMIAGALASIAETAYVGHLGVAPLAGISLVFPILMLQQMLSAGSIGGGISSSISRAIGADDLEKANSLAWHSFILCLTLGVGLSLLFLLFDKQIFSLIGGQGVALDEALSYSRITFLGATWIWLAYCFSAIIRATGDMKTPSSVLFLVSLGQVVLAGVLGLGLGPIPRLGITGVALGQVIAFFSGTLYLYFYLRSSRSKLRLSSRHAFSKQYFIDILKVGGLSSISSIQTVLTILILTRIVASFGTEALAGYGIGTRLEFLLIPITFAVGVACLPMIGMALGAKLVARARQVAWIGSALAAVIIQSIGLLVAFFPNVWIRLFTQDPVVQSMSQEYFLWVAPVYGFFSFGLCLYFCSQGAGKMFAPLVGSTLRLLVVALGGAYLLQQGTNTQGIFQLIALAMICYGVSTAILVKKTQW